MVYQCILDFLHVCTLWPWQRSSQFALVNYVVDSVEFNRKTWVILNDCRFSFLSWLLNLKQCKFLSNVRLFTHNFMNHWTVFSIQIYHSIYVLSILIVISHMYICNIKLFLLYWFGFTYFSFAVERWLFIKRDLC